MTRRLKTAPLPALRLLLVTILAGNLAGCLWWVGLNLAGIHEQPALAGFIQAHRWIRENAPADAVILSRKPTVTALLSGRRAAIFPYSSDGERLLKEISRAGATHVLADGAFPETRRHLWPAMAQNPDAFEPEARLFGRAVLWTVRKKKNP